MWSSFPTGFSQYTTPISLTCRIEKNSRQSSPAERCRLGRAPYHPFCALGGATRLTQASCHVGATVRRHNFNRLAAQPRTLGAENRTRSLGECDFLRCVVALSHQRDRMGQAARRWHHRRCINRYGVLNECRKVRCRMPKPNLVDPIPDRPR
jgi:hypothetical protein